MRYRFLLNGAVLAIMALALFAATPMATSAAPEAQRGGSHVGHGGGGHGGIPVGIIGPGGGTWGFAHRGAFWGRGFGFPVPVAVGVPLLLPPVVPVAVAAPMAVPYAVPVPVPVAQPVPAAAPLNLPSACGCPQ